MMLIGLQVWLRILARNRGLSYRFIMGELPRAQVDVYVDAALSGGVGGFFGWRFFSLTITQLRPYLALCDG